MILRSSLFCIAASGLLLSATAGATTLSTSSFSGWEASLTGSATELDFSPIQYTGYNTSTGLILDAIGNPSLTFDFTGSNGQGGYYLNGFSYSGTKSLEGSSNSGASITVAMPGSGVNALLFSIATSGYTPATVTLSDGETFSVAPGLTGLTLSQDVTWATVSTTAGSQAIVDDFWFGASSLSQNTGGSGGSGGGSATPEGATLILMAGGLLVLMGAWRKYGNSPSSSAA